MIWVLLSQSCNYIILGWELPTLAYILLLNYVCHTQNYYLNALSESHLEAISHFFCGSDPVIPKHVTVMYFPSVLPVKYVCFNIQSQKYVL